MSSAGVGFPNPSQILPKSFQTIWSDFFLPNFALGFQNHRTKAEHGSGHGMKFAYLYHRAVREGIFNTSYYYVKTIKDQPHRLAP
jgi:hypothetical protein